MGIVNLPTAKCRVLHPFALLRKGGRHGCKVSTSPLWLKAIGIHRLRLIFALEAQRSILAQDDNFGRIDY